MSQESAGLSSSRRERFRKIRLSHRGTVGVAELIGLSVAALMLLAVVVGYLYFQIPAQLSVAARTRDRDHLKETLRTAKEALRHVTDTKAQVEKITVSLDDFENRRLVDRDEGRMTLYEDLNELIRKNTLRNTSGPEYTSLEPIVLKAQGQPAPPASNSAANKWQSMYPGIGVSVTVEGQYQSIRHFVRDIESSKEFTIINAVELERATGSNAQPAVEAGPVKSGSGNALVSLRLDLATYFSRPAQVDKPAANAATVH